MKKKFLVSFLAALAAVLCGIFAFSACDIKEEENGLSFQTLTVDGTNVYGKVSNATETFSFLKEVTARGNSKFIVALDIYGTQPVVTKTIPLAAGDNTAYIMEMLDGEMVKMYTVTVRRRPMYTVSFDTIGGTAVQSQQVEEDSLATAPESVPERQGYTFEEWNYDFSQAVTGDTVITAKWNEMLFTLNESGDTITGLTAYGKYKTDLIIPSKIDGVKITAISSTAFRDCSFLRSITIGDGVTSVGYGAFYNCGLLGNISVSPKNATYHSSGNCLIETASKTLILGCKNSVIPTDGSVTSIGDRAFSGCAALERITIPDGVTSIGYYAFGGCISLKSITIPNGVTTIGYGTFWGCGSLERMTIPDGVTSIDEYAFAYCRGLTSITIPDNVTSIGDSAFEGCDNLAYNAENGLKYLGNPDNLYLYLAYADKGIKTAQINSRCRFIGAASFSDCSSLEGIMIPDGITSIGDYAFYGCASITSITIPNSVTSIGDSAFSGCSSLTSITIPSSVTSIGDNAFSVCTSLTSITIPNSVTSIGFFAFSGCRSLTSITIPSSVTSIGGRAFYNCTSLTSITIPNSVTSIGVAAFKGCDSLQQVYYKGTAKEWQEISINYDNNNLTAATRYYYSETTPTESGKFWHYGANGEIVEW